MRKNIFGAGLFLAVVMLFSCKLSVQTDEVNAQKKVDDEIDADYSVYSGERQWTILVYMSADNNLESAAIDDLNEMELSTLNTDEVSVLVLLDRSSSYDSSNGNWSGTRLYKLKTGKKSSQSGIQSEEIECKNLGLSVGTETHLDMSSNWVLENALDFMVSKYEANHYGLVIWGHGTGWRSEENVNEKEISGYKGFSYDETSGSYMSLYQMNKSLESVFTDKKLDFIGFDTCFGGCIEVMYELKDSVDYGAGSEGLLLSSGWNYENLFNYFGLSSEKTCENLCECVIRQFSEEYETNTRASICAVNLSKISDLFSTFDSYCGKLAEKITSASLRDDLMGILYSNADCKTERYTYGKSGFDVYLDIYSLVNESKSFADDLSELSDAFINAESDCVIKSWASDREKGSLGVFFQNLSTSEMLSVSHPSAYIQKKTLNQSGFVQKSSGYVPALNGNSSLLDKLFYVDFYS